MSAPLPTDVTVVLVHGAFADASSWAGVVRLLQQRGCTVVAPPNPLRGLTADTAYLASFLDQLDGPVLLVGHSYGGAVITGAATTAGNVVGLVYVAAFAPEEGERLGEVEAGSTDSVLNAAIRPRRYPSGPDGAPATEFVIDPAQLHDAFAGDLPAEEAAVLATVQRPVAESAFGEPCGPPAWRRLPSWAVVATGDRAAGTDVVRSMAQRAGAQIVEVEASHVVLVSQPERVAEVVATALQAVAGEPATPPSPRSAPPTADRQTS